jgi:oligoendopeptidase F
MNCMSDESTPATKADLEFVKNDFHERIEFVKTELLERIEKSETTLLREFRKWAISFESRFRANQTLVDGFSERMVSLEERVSDLERKL